MPWGLVPAAFKEAGLVFVSPSGHQATRLGLTWSLVESVVHHGGTEFDHPGWKIYACQGGKKELWWNFQIPDVWKAFRITFWK